MVQYFPSITGSLTVQGNVLITGSINTTAGITGSFSGTATTAQTASSVANLNQNVQITGSLTTSGTITAQTLVVSTISSSIEYASGSNIFGSSMSNRQQMTGSVSITGSFTQTGANTTASFAGWVGIGTTTVNNKLDINQSGSATNSVSGIGLKVYADQGNDASIAISQTARGTATIGMAATGSAPADMVIGTDVTGNILFKQGMTIGTLSTGTERMRITSGGNVGIGTATPFAIADTNLTINGATSSAIQLGYNGTRYGQFYTDSGEVRLSAVANLPLTFYSNNLERMRITSGGNVGIGTSSPVGPLMIAVPATGSAIAATTSQQAYDYSRLRITHYTASSVGLSIGYAGTNYTYIQTCYNEGTTAPLLINPFGGNVGIGTTSPSYILDVQTSAVTQARFRGSSTDAAIIRLENSTSTQTYGIGAAGSANLGGAPNNSFYVRDETANAVRLAITSGGIVMVNRTATGGQSAKMQINTDGGDGYLIQQNSAGGFCFAGLAVSNGGTYYFNYFQAGASQVGQITSNGSTTTYATSSDYRIKEDFKDFNGLDSISNIKVYDFKYKDSENRMKGVVAHELQEVIPYAVVGEKDGEMMQGVDYSLIVPVLIKAIQEQNQLIEDLKSRLDKAGL